MTPCNHDGTWTPDLLRAGTLEWIRYQTEGLCPICQSWVPIPEERQGEYEAYLDGTGA